MTYILLSIAASTAIFVIFKCFKKFGIHTLTAIVVNYMVAFVYGMAHAKGYSWSTIHKKPWFFTALVLGFLFIWVFRLMALTAQRNGLSVASVAGKMSVIIPVIAAIVLYGDGINGLKIIAIFTALMAVYLTAIKQKGIIIDKKTIIFPLLLFLSSGGIDTVMNYAEKRYLSFEEIPLYSAIIFCFAALSGVGLLAYTKTQTHVPIRYKDIAGGLLLGVANFYSAYFLLNALKDNTYNSSTVFIINNVGVVLLTTLLSIVLFREQLLPKNWVGIALALGSIVLIALSQ